MLECRSPATQAIWSDDGTRIAVASADRQVRVWSADGKGDPVTLEAAAPIIALRFLDGGKTLLGVAADDATYTWTLDVGALREGLAASNADCLPPEMRIVYFGDGADGARRGYDVCVAAHGHPGVRSADLTPSRNDEGAAPSGPKAPSGPAVGLRPGERRMSVFVLPGDAVVEVDGKPARRRDGVIEVLVEAGGKKRLTAGMGVTVTKVAEKPVNVDATAPKAMVVDLNEKPLQASKEKGAGFGFGN